MQTDTDSVIFVSKPNDPEPTIGPYLGELTDGLGGDYITAFVSEVKVTEAKGEF